MTLTKLVTALLTIVTITAAIPKTLSYQGVLTDEHGTPKNNGSYNITFSIYDKESDGGHLWRSTKTVVVKKGVLATILGTETPFPETLDFTVPYWLGIQIETAAELTPLIPLTASGYAIRSSISDSAVHAMTAAVANSITDAALVSADAAADFKAPLAGTADSAAKAGIAETGTLVLLSILV